MFRELPFHCKGCRISHKMAREDRSVDVHNLYSFLLLLERLLRSSAYSLVFQLGTGWTQFWSRPKWAPIRDMGQDTPRPTTRIELEEGLTEVAIIAQQETKIEELARRSRSRFSIKKEKKQGGGHIENPRESLTFISILLSSHF